MARFVITARSPNPINGEGELKAVKDSSFITLGRSYRGGQGDRWGAISQLCQLELVSGSIGSCWLVFTGVLLEPCPCF